MKHASTPGISILSLPFAYQEKLLRAFALALLLSLGVSYVYQVNALTQSLYTVSQQEETAKKLQQETRTLETTARTGTFKHVEELAALSQFEKVNSISYVRLFEKAVARNTAVQQ